MPEDKIFKHLYHPEDGYVFLVTYGRSGSTLMSNYLNSFPGYCIRGENNNVIHHLCSAILSLDGVNFTHRRESNSKPFEERRPAMQRIMGTPRDPWYGAELVDPARFAKTIFDGFVREVLSLPKKTRVAGFKEIKWANNLGRLRSDLDLISKYFPKTRFIFQTREAGAVAKSGWWAKRPPESVKRYIANADAAFLDYAKGNESCIHIKYEDLIEGEPTLRRLAAFLGEDFCSDTAQRVLDEKLTHLKKPA